MLGLTRVPANPQPRLSIRWQNYPVHRRHSQWKWRLPTLVMADDTTAAYAWAALLIIRRVHGVPVRLIPYCCWWLLHRSGLHPPADNRAPNLWQNDAFVCHFSLGRGAKTPKPGCNLNEHTGLTSGRGLLPSATRSIMLP